MYVHAHYLYLLSYRATLQPAINSLGGRPDSDTCKFPLLMQAGFSSAARRLKLDRMKVLADSFCTNFAAGKLIS